MNIDEQLELLRNGKLIEELNVKILCDIVKSILVEESTVTVVNSPVNVCGDIHGQFFDLLELFKKGGEIPRASYVFIGDFIDRGYNSVETFEYLLCLKALYPDRVTLLRGNHESR